MHIQRISQNNKYGTFKAFDVAEAQKLTDVLSKRIYGKQRAIDICKNMFPKAEGVSLGASGLPGSWMNRVKDIANFDLPKFCERLGKIFTEDRFFSNIDSMNKSLKTLFTQFGIINEDDKFKVSYLEKGFFGRAYKVDINGEEPKVIKEYKRIFRYQNNHGNYSEQNIAEYINKFSGNNTNMAKYYYGDTKHGIMILDFISKDTPNPENIVELDELGLAYDDGKPRNLINGYIIDYGGIITISNLVGRKNAQNVYREFKYLEDDSKKRELFEKIINDVENQNYKENLIGLTHSIKFFPESEQLDLYRRMYEFNETDINIALVENFKNLSITNRNNEIVQNLAKTEDILVKEIIAREIKSFPTDLTHSLMEKLSTEDNNTIKKYLARNLNLYYKDRDKRIEIYDNLMKNADLYANVALINALDNLPTKERDIRFEKFISLNDKIVSSALARNIETFQNDESLMKKWVDRLMQIDSTRVKRALCESVRYMPEKLMYETFERLADVHDMNSKEFLAETLTSVPYYSSNPDWFDRIFEASGNSVKRELAKVLKNVDSPILKEKWARKLYTKGDSSVKEILAKQGIIFNS